MEWYIVLYIVLTFLTAAVTTLLAIYAWRHRHAPGARAFTVLLLLITGWSLTATLQALSPPGTAMWRLWMNLKYLAIASAPPALLVFVLQYTKQQRWVTARRVLYLALVPTITQMLVWTNPWHYWWLLPEGVPGAWFWVHTAYSFILIFIGLTLMSLAVVRMPALRRWQVLLLLFGFILPLVVNIFHTFRLIPYVVDLTPVAFTVTAIAFAWVLYRHRLFDLTPLAREVLVDGMQDAMLVLDTEHRVVDYNPAVLATLGVVDADISDKPAASVIPSWTTFLPYVEAEVATEVELVLTTADESCYYETRITPLYDYQQSLAGFLLLLHDVTERQHAEKAVRQYAEALEVRNAELDTRNAELDAFAHTVAHDLKNPLSVLVGFSSLLEARLDKLPTDRVYETLQRITQTGYKMTNIINELLLLASVRKVDEVDIRPLDMGAIVAQMQERLDSMLVDYDAELIVLNEWPVALGYAPWVEEIWTNYVSNALKYGGTPPRVELGANVVDGWVRFWCRDNGSGLTDAERSKLFAQFTRLHEMRAQGHGLGLSIVRRIVTKLGGEAGVESAPGQGSTFWFALKRHSSSEA